ncbi:MAG: sarcosine oxidase [Candidatus Pelagadaptatus aseana]|uniref:sarcosine oxidase subunit gamma n=1 Tax=Candidatus Pelagadaptatus aseana TaxID=3120508 RepID=UPI0039B15DFC
MNAVSAESFHKRSLTHRLHAGTQWVERNNSAVVQHYSPADTQEQLQRCALLDLSGLARTGLRGKSAQTILAEQGLPFPEAPNQAAFADSGAIVARLGSSECWVLDNPLDEAAEVCAALDQRAQADAQAYPLYCQHSHAWFALTGRHLPELMAKICGVDLRPEAFPVGAVVQTSVARVNAIIVHHEIQGCPVFSVLCDSSLSEYFWAALLDAMQEFGGQPVGLSAFG